MSFKVISSTIGRSSPATVSQDAEDTGRYHYRGDKNWPQDRSAYTDPAPRPGTVPAGARSSTERKRQRLEAFADVLADLGCNAQTASGTVLIQAAQRIGVSYDTARGYRNELRRQQGRVS